MISTVGVGEIDKVRRSVVVTVEKTENGRVAYITDVFPGVTLTFVYLEIKKLREQGMRIDIYAIWRPKQKIVASEADCFQAETTYLSPPPILQLLRAHFHYARNRSKQYLDNLRLCVAAHAKLRLRRRTIYNFCLAPYLTMLLANKQIKHIHAHFASGAATTAMMAAKLLDISFSFTAHRGDILEGKALLDEKLKQAKFAVSISEYNRTCLLREAPDVAEDKVKTIHCGVATDVFLPSERAHSGPLVFLSVGSLLERKGHVFLVEACRLLNEYDINYRCIIVGNGPQRNSLQNVIYKYKLEEKVLLVGSVPHEDIQSYYDKADVFVLPSLNEGIPVVLMEAMSKGLAVIATNITGVSELVTNERHGILAAPGEYGELAGAMIRLSKDTELRKFLGANARKKIQSDFNVDINTAKIRKLFEAL
jgi:glycosyltransferase involved in cell wall biosynthesis